MPSGPETEERTEGPGVKTAYCPGLFLGFVWRGPFRLPGPVFQNTRTQNKEADELHLSNYITPGNKFKTRLITLHMGT